MGSIISEMGWLQLCTRGLPLRIAMVGTLTGLQVTCISCLCSHPALQASESLLSSCGPHCGFLQCHFALVLPASFQTHSSRPRQIYSGIHHTLTSCPVIIFIGWACTSTILTLPLPVVQWGIYDAYKVYVGLPTTGAAPPPKQD